jgi:hypothetical protein
MLLRIFTKDLNDLTKNKNFAQARYPLVTCKMLLMIKMKQMVYSTILILTIHFDLVQLTFGLNLTKLKLALIAHNLGHGSCLNNGMFNNLKKLKQVQIQKILKLFFGQQKT